METVRVIPAAGATVRGPARLKLTPEQAGPRAPLLGPVRKDGLYTLDGGREVQFKAGETIGLDGAAGRLNLALFAPVAAKPKGGE